MFKCDSTFLFILLVFPQASTGHIPPLTSPPHQAQSVSSSRLAKLSTHNRACAAALVVLSDWLTPPHNSGHSLANPAIFLLGDSYVFRKHSLLLFIINNPSFSTIISSWKFMKMMLKKIIVISCEDIFIVVATP